MTVHSWLEITGHHPKWVQGEEHRQTGSLSSQVGTVTGSIHKKEQRKHKKKKKNLMMLVGCEGVFPKSLSGDCPTLRFSAPGGASVRYAPWGPRRLSREARGCEKL